MGNQCLYDEDAEGQICEITFITEVDVFNVSYLNYWNELLCVSAGSYCGCFARLLEPTFQKNAGQGSVHLSGLPGSV